MTEEFVRLHHSRVADAGRGTCSVSQFCKLVTCETADAKAACETSRSFIHKMVVIVKIFDPQLQLLHDPRTFCLPRAVATILKVMLAYCLALIERGCQRFKRAPHTLDHSDITYEHKHKGDATNELWKKTCVLTESVK